MIIDLKRSIDIRWLFDPVLSFILRGSCFLLQLNPLYMRRIWHLVSRIMKNRYMVRVYKYNWRWEIMSSVFFHGLHYSSLPYIQSREGGCMHQSQPGSNQTWNLSKNLHRWIFRLKILHRQFYLISTVLVRKKHKKWVKMEKFTPLAKILHCRRHWRDGQIPPLREIGIDF